MTALRHLLLSFSVETLRGTNIEENTAVLNNYVVFNMPTKKLILLKYNNGPFSNCLVHPSLYMVITINDNSRHRFLFSFFVVAGFETKQLATLLSCLCGFLLQ